MNRLRFYHALSTVGSGHSHCLTLDPLPTVRLRTVLASVLLLLLSRTVWSGAKSAVLDCLVEVAFTVICLENFLLSVLAFTVQESPNELFSAL